MYSFLMQSWSNLMFVFWGLAECYKSSNEKVLLPCWHIVSLLYLEKQRTPEKTYYINCSTHRFLLKGDLGMSAKGIICSPGRTHMMGPSSLSVGLCSRRLEKVPHGRVLCSSTKPDTSHYIVTQKQGGLSHHRRPWWCLYVHKHKDAATDL